MEKNKKGTLSTLASVITSLVITLIFYIFARLANTQSNIYTQVDIVAGMIFVFILSMIVSASIWPSLLEKRLRLHTYN
ncbi:MAG TPA: hypothetical protein EYP22_04895 [Methanosarcinales archaeon]|nr:hypothetical protein [Methanosarcinales archaeon]